MQCEHLAGAIRPSIELALHTAVYCARPDVGAIVHTHSHYATAAASGSDMPILMEKAVRAIGSNAIPCATFAPAGTRQLAENAAAALGSEGKALLLSEHGTLALGGNVQEAFAISEMIEKAAEIYMLSLSGGDIQSNGDLRKRK